MNSASSHVRELVTEPIDEPVTIAQLVEDVRRITQSLDVLVAACLHLASRMAADARTGADGARRE